MKYKVHRMEINLEKDQEKLEQFLNNLRGEVVSIIPNIAKTIVTPRISLRCFFKNSSKRSRFTGHPKRHIPNIARTTVTPRISLKCFPQNCARRSRVTSQVSKIRGTLTICAMLARSLSVSFITSILHCSSKQIIQEADADAERLAARF